MNRYHIIVSRVLNGRIVKGDGKIIPLNATTRVDADVEAQTLTGSGEVYEYVHSDGSPMTDTEIE